MDKDLINVLLDLEVLHKTVRICLSQSGSKWENDHQFTLEVVCDRLHDLLNYFDRELRG